MICLYTAPCGEGKTRFVAAQVEEWVGKGKSVLYIAPTVALANQFRSYVSEETDLPPETVRVITGRRIGENCRNPLVSVLPHLGQNQRDFCGFCDNARVCLYQDGLENFRAGRGVIATTYAFARWQMLDPAQEPFDIVIYDDPPLFFHEATGPEAKLLRVSLKSPYLSGKEYVAGFPKLPEGKEATYIYTATPTPSIYSAVFGKEVVDKSGGNRLILRQVVYQSLYHLTMSSRSWNPPPGSCGFKDNTPPGLPYVGASMGLSDWRGKPLTATGTFLMPLAKVYPPLLALLKLVTGKEWSLTFAPLVYQFSSGTTIPSGYWAIVADGKLDLELSFLSVFQLLQLLGRSGVDVVNRYIGDCPLNGTIYGTEFRFVQEVRLEVAPPKVLEFHSVRNEVANVVVGNLTPRELSRKARGYYKFVMSILGKVNARANQLYETKAH